MKDEKVFNELYAKLNKAQREAVDTIEGPVMVIAGPGTGKTQILTLRIANILRRTDTAPEQILALTFTEAGTSAMRTRLASVIGVRAYRVPIFTFHGFCNEIINRFPEYFPQILGSRPASELDRITIMQKVLDDTKLEHLASFRSPYHYVKPALRTISLLKREAIDPSALRARLDAEEKDILSAFDYRHEKGAHKGKVKGVYLEREMAVAKNRELAILFDGYEAGLAREKLYDFDDMIVTLVRKLEENEELRLILQEEYQYLLADEHQDANGAQNKVLELLSSFHQSPNLFIVGDEKQAIYRFQGASLENFLYFHRRFPEAKLIALEENYRSTQAVLDVAHKLIPGEKVKLKARAGHSEKSIAIREFSTVADESEAVAKDIVSKIKNGVPPEEIALFTRTNRELALYSSALVRNGVPVSIQTKEDIEDDPDIEKLLMLIKAAAKVGEDGTLITALHADCFDITELDIFILAREAAKRHVSVWKIASSKDALIELKLKNPDEVFRVVELIGEWGKLGRNVSPAVLFSTVARESGIVSQMLAMPDAEEKLTKLSILLTYLEEYLRTHRGARIGELLSVLKLLDEYNVLEVKIAGNATGKVKLMTAHRAKGLEFDHVYVVGASEGNWSGGRSHTDFKLPGVVATTKEDEEADDRRLFYVALTRARKDLSISYPIMRDDGKAILPTRFLSELPEDLVMREGLAAPSSIETMVNRLSPAVLPPESIGNIRNFVRETLADRGLAVTGLNNYLTCPWQYFYRTLLRIPEPQNVSLMFGTAVHETLKTFFNAWADKKDMSRGEFIARFESELDRGSFTDKELEEVREKGIEILTGYYDFWYPNWSRDIKNEFPVDVMFPVDDFELRLTGKLDKVEFLDSGEVSVVDYKTGKPKSRNHIEGNTKGEGAGDYKRQLTFYKLLLDLYDPDALTGTSSKYLMKTGVIDFIESNDKGKYHREEFAITSEEVAELKDTVTRVAREILSLSFWDKRCDDKNCEYCRLREMLRK